MYSHSLVVYLSSKASDRLFGNFPIYPDHNPGKWT
jgi:hypothetical protein